MSWPIEGAERLLGSTSLGGDRRPETSSRGVQERFCDLPSLPLAKVERAVADHYVHIAIPEHHRQALESKSIDAGSDSREATKSMKAALHRQLTDLDARENWLLDLLGDPDWPQDKLKRRMRDIRDARARAESQLLTIATVDVDPRRALLQSRRGPARQPS